MEVRSEKGSSTIEGAIVFPVILLLLFTILGVLIFCYNRFNVLNSSSTTLRNSGYNWYNGKSLYEDIICDFNDASSTLLKFSAAENLFEEHLEPTYVNHIDSGFSIRNYILYKVIVLNASFDQNRLFALEESYPVYIGSVVIRNFDYTKELLEDAFEFLEDNLQDEGQSVYIVDDNVDEQEYDRVYHLYQDCSYLRNGYSSSVSLSEGRDLGFRVCRICLARKTGMD